jgi:2-polyprenyl-3-methyl-5-hydroxy-6-metoxy-1,4-benzoquinol methylase
MTETESVQAVREWWAQNPMTYADVHGRTVYGGEAYEAGTPAFFERLDRVFYSGYPHLHATKPFDRLFPYERYAPRSRVLEVGCGLGTMAMNWARHGMAVTAVDLNPTSIELTRKRFALQGLEGSISLEDARSLPFGDGEFAYAYSWGVLHHSPDLERSLAELMRVLAPGGGYGIMLYNRTSLLYLYFIRYLEGFLHYENRFLGPLELASRYGDGAEQEGNPHTWPITTKEAHTLLAPYSKNVRVKQIGMDVDLDFRMMLPLLGGRLPRFLKKPWARHLGWHLWISGTKD